MAHTQGSTSRSKQLIAAAAIALLAVATALAFGRVFQGHGATLRLLAVALASGAVAIAMERRNLATATLFSALLLIVVVALFVFPHTTWYGLPTMEALKAALRATRLVTEQARLHVAPTPPLRPLLLAALLATWAAIFSSHALAFRAGSPLLALIPPISLVVFADTVLDHFSRPLYGVAFLLAALALIFADGLRRVDGWGPIWMGAGPSERLLRGAGGRARRVALAVLGVALVAPLLIPGFGSKAVIDIRGASFDQRVRIDPFVSIVDALSRDDPVELFQVQTDQPTYLRMLAMDRFDGTRFHPELESRAVPVGPSEVLSLSSQDWETFKQHVRVQSALGNPWLPIAFPALTIDSAHSLRYDASTGTVFVDDGLIAGDSYAVTTYLQQPTRRELRAESFDDRLGIQPEKYVQLPNDLPPRVAQIAREWTAGAASDYDAIMMIQDRLTDPTEFTYDDKIEARDSDFTLVDFLDRTKVGFCQQFSTAMTVLLRSLGIPARVALGFTQGSPSSSAPGTWKVTTDNAHAWVEVKFPTYGWLAFEPTPGRSNPVAFAYNTRPSPTDPGEGPAGPPIIRDPGQQALDPRQEIDAGEAIPGLAGFRCIRGRCGTGSASVEVTGLDRLQIYGIVSILGVLGFLLVAPVRALRRRIRLRRSSGEPRKLILATYDVFAERAADLGFSRGAGETLEEYRARLANDAAADGELEKLTWLATRAAYDSAEPTEEDARGATEAAATAIRELRHKTRLLQRVVGAYRRG
jgi:transglutaminase-like putative cysteine protease